MFRKLVGMIVSGAVDFKADKPENRPIIASGFCFAWSVFHGMNLATTRKFVVRENGEHTPTKNSTTTRFVCKSKGFSDDRYTVSWSREVVDRRKRGELKGRLQERCRKNPDGTSCCFKIQIRQEHKWRRTSPGCWVAGRRKCSKARKYVDACLLRFVNPSLK